MSDLLRWICDQYRSQLQQSDPHACEKIDKQMIDSGQAWVCDNTIVNPDELVTALDAEARFGITRIAFWHIVRRHQIKPQGKKGTSNLYRLGDVLRTRAAR